MLGVAASLLLAFAQAQAPAKPVGPLDRSGEGYLTLLLEKYSKLPPFYVWIDRYSGDGESEGFDKGGTAQLWYGGGKQFRIYSAGSFGDDRLAVSDGKSLLLDPLDMQRAVEIKDMPAKWEGLTEQFAPNQSGCMLLWLMDGKASLDTLAEKDKPITCLRDGNAFVVSFTNKDLGKINVEIIDGWLTADEFDQSFEFDGIKFEFRNRNVYRPFVFSPKFPKGVFDVIAPKGAMTIDQRKKTKPPIG